MTKAQLAGASAAKVLRIALASTGIGAIVVALGSLITFLLSKLTNYSIHFTVFNIYLRGPSDTVDLFYYVQRVICRQP